MQTYLGVKLIKATPMDRQAYNDYRGWTLPDDENGSDLGYLVEYLDGGESNHPDHEGYVSWSPKRVFENAYREIHGLTFGLAVEALKQGKSVAREGWNGKGMFIYMTFGKKDVPATDIWGKGGQDFANARGGAADVRPYLVMKTAQGDLVPWVASQTDVLTEDWEIV